MNRESLHLLDTKQGFMKKAMAACERYIAGQPQSLAGMSAGLSVGVIACICAGILGAAAVLPEVVSKKGASAEVPDGTASGDLPVAETRIAFSGGDPSYAHLNPQKAACEISGLSVSGWTITAAEGGEALFSGSGGSADIPVSSLGSGAYRVTFTAADRDGAEYRLYNNFHILHNTDGA